MQVTQVWHGDKLLLTADSIRKALGKTYRILRRFDRPTYERNVPRTVRRQLFKEFPKVCAACASKPRSGVQIDAAHIEASEECGKTEVANLLPLCRRPGKRRAERGCHQLYDDGYASRCEIREARERLCEGSPDTELRSRLQERFRSHAREEEWRRGAYRKALEDAENRKKKVPLGSDERYQLDLEVLGNQRRRTVRGMLEEAERRFEEILKKPIPDRFRSRLFYEGGYINLLLGKHEMALKYFLMDRDSANVTEETGKVEWATAAPLVVQAKVALLSEKAPWAELHEQLDTAKQYIQNRRELHPQRLAITSDWNRVRLYIAEGDLSAAKKACDAAIGNWEKMSVETGWHYDFRSIIVAIRGQLLALEAKRENDKSIAHEALRYLSRAVVVLLGGRRRQPEGTRDVLFAAADALDLIGWTKDARQGREIATRTRDGSSWLYPYRWGKG